MSLQKKGEDDKDMRRQKIEKLKKLVDVLDVEESGRDTSLFESTRLLSMVLPNYIECELFQKRLLEHILKQQLSYNGIWNESKAGEQFVFSKYIPLRVVNDIFAAVCLEKYEISLVKEVASQVFSEHHFFLVGFASWEW
jgi:hypothetical protein